MSKFYILRPDSNPEYPLHITLPPNLHLDERAIRWGKFQFINDEEEVFTVKSPPKRLPDLYWDQYPLISETFKDVFDDARVTNIFYKPIILEVGSKYYQYYIPVIRAIACVDWRKSHYREERGTVGLKRICGGFAIDSSRTGNFQIFRISDVVNDFWIINDTLKEMIVAAAISGVTMIETTSYQE